MGTGKTHTAKSPVPSTFQSQHVAAFFGSLHYGLRNNGHVDVQAIQAGDVSVLLEPRVIGFPHVAVQLLIGVHGEDALFLSKGKKG